MEAIARNINNYFYDFTIKKLCKIGGMVRRAIANYRLSVLFRFAIDRLGTMLRKRIF
jgi:hypothetical protein